MPREVNVAMDVARLREILGLDENQLPDDATDEQVTEALKASAPETPKDDPEKDDPEKDGPEKDPEKKDPKADAPRQVQGGVIVDQAMWAETQKELAAVRKDREERETKADQEFLKVAVRKGKFPAARVDHYMTLMKADRDGTREFIDNLPEGLPVEEFGSLGDLDDALKASDYPEAWLAPAERRRVKAAQAAYAEGRIGDVEPGTIVR